MSRHGWRPNGVAYCVLGFCLLGAHNLVAAEPDHAQLAQRVVKTCANVKPGDVVVVWGGQHTVPLMQAVAIEAQKAGGMVTMFLNTDAMARSRWVEMPEQFLEQEPRYMAEWFKEIDVLIGLPDLENPLAVWGDVPEAKFAKANKAGMFLGNLFNTMKIRGFFVGLPARADAELFGIDFATYEQMHWAAVNADYAKIAEQGSTLKQMLAGAKQVHITSPSGTDVTMAIGDRPLFVADGVLSPEDVEGDLLFTRMANLPGGSIVVAPIEDSANGRVVIPKHRVRKDPLVNARFAFKNGKVTDFQADQGAAQYVEIIAAHEGAKEILGSLSIGLNPVLKVMEENGAGYRPVEAAGMVYLNTGDNQLLKGKNIATGGFDFPITNATVTVDGKVVIKDGKLTF